MLYASLQDGLHDFFDMAIEKSSGASRAVKRIFFLKVQQ
jgi:hypothetical protein